MEETTRLPLGSESWEFQTETQNRGAEPRRPSTATEYAVPIGTRSETSSQMSSSGTGVTTANSTGASSAALTPILPSQPRVAPHVELLKTVPFANGAPFFHLRQQRCPLPMVPYFFVSPEVK